MHGSGLAARDLEDQVGDFLGVGHQRQVARRQLDGGGVHALGEEALQVRLDGLVIRRHCIPGRLGVPGGVGGATAEQGLGDGLLHGVQLHGLGMRHIAGKVFEEGLLAQGEVAVVVFNAGPHRHAWILCRERDKVLIGVRRAGGHVHQGADLRVGPGVDSTV